MSIGVFSSIADFFSMNGYASQVWGALVVSLIIIAILFAQTIYKQRKLQRMIEQQTFKRSGKAE